MGNKKVEQNPARGKDDHDKNLEETVVALLSLSSLQTLSGPFSAFVYLLPMFLTWALYKYLQIAQLQRPSALPALLSSVRCQRFHLFTRWVNNDRGVQRRKTCGKRANRHTAKGVGN